MKLCLFANAASANTQNWVKALRPRGAEIHLLSLVGGAEHGRDAPLVACAANFGPAGAKSSRTFVAFWSGMVRYARGWRRRQKGWGWNRPCYWQEEFQKRGIFFPCCGSTV